jgi:hypothetical protein
MTPRDDPCSYHLTSSVQVEYPDTDNCQVLGTLHHQPFPSCATKIGMHFILFLFVSGTVKCHVKTNRKETDIPRVKLAQTRTDRGINKISLQHRPNKSFNGYCGDCALFTGRL